MRLTDPVLETVEHRGFCQGCEPPICDPKQSAATCHLPQFPCMSDGPGSLWLPSQGGYNKVLRGRRSDHPLEKPSVHL